MGPCFNFSVMNYLSLSLSLSLYCGFQCHGIVVHYNTISITWPFFCLCSLSFFKNNCFLCFGFFMIVKKKKARKANSHVRWLVMVGSCWCWCSRWLALYDWWLYGITERKPFFLSFMFLCTQTRLVRLSLSQLHGGFLLFLRVHDCD